MKEELDDIDLKDDSNEFNSLMQDKRHKEIIKSLNNISNSLSENKKDNSLSIALNNQISSIEKFADAIKSLPKPEVNVQTNHQPLINSIEKMKTDILQSLDETKDVMNELLQEVRNKKEWHHSITKKQYGNFDITSKQIK